MFNIRFTIEFFQFINERIKKSENKKFYNCNVENTSIKFCGLKFR